MSACRHETGVFVTEEISIHRGSSNVRQISEKTECIVYFIYCKLLNFLLVFTACKFLFKKMHVSFSFYYPFSKLRNVLLCAPPMVILCYPYTTMNILNRIASDAC